MYKRRRRAHPVLPTSSAEATSAVSSSRYAQLEDSDFCRGVADAGERICADLGDWRPARTAVVVDAAVLWRSVHFKVVPTIHYQLFNPFVPFTFPVCYALMSRKTTELYVKVFQKVQQLVPQFTPMCAMADFEASVAVFQRVYTIANVAGRWFHYSQAVHLWSGAALSGLTMPTNGLALSIVSRSQSPQFWWSRDVRSQKMFSVAPLILTKLANGKTTALSILYDNRIILYTVVTPLRVKISSWNKLTELYDEIFWLSKCQTHAV